MNRGFSTIASIAIALGAWCGIAQAQLPEEIAKVELAMPGTARVTPAKPRKLLVFTLCKGFVHSSIPIGTKAIMRMGEKTCAYTAVHSEDPAVFAPESLAQFDAVCMLNTTGELFEDPALKQSLLDFVKSGKGLIGIHAATDCFYQWADYGAMMGGYFDGHPWGARDTVTTKIDDPMHPVNRVFRGQGFSITDEIYQFKEEPYTRAALRVLFSLDTEKTDMTKQGIKRTDGDFAVAWVSSYGQGRVFYCSLGHNEMTYWNPKILQHYLDGIQFALGDLTADTTPSAKLPPEYLQNNAEALEQQILDDVFVEIAAYEPGKDASGLALVTDTVVKSFGDQNKRRALESRLGALLKSEATNAGKQFAAKQLFLMGSRDSLPVLEQLILDPENSDNARYALERMQPGRPDILLRAALEKSEGAIKVGIINTIGERRNPTSVPDISRLAASEDPAIALAALRALGKIGGQGAIDALTQVKNYISPDHIRAWNEAMLASADQVLADGNAEAAAQVYAQMSGVDVDPVTQLAALQGLAQAQGEAAIPTLLSALQGDDARLRASAAQALQVIPGPGATQAIADALAGASATAQPLILQTLKARGDATALAAATTALKSEDAAVRIAAAEALGVLGNASTIEPIAVQAATTSGDEQLAARNSLTLLRGADVNGAMVTAFAAGDESVRAELVQALGNRYAKECIPTLFDAARDANEGVRTRAFEALGMVAAADQLQALVDLAVKEAADAPRAEAERAAVASMSRGGDPAACAAVLLNAMAAAKDDVRAQATVVHVLGKVVDPASLAALRDAAGSRNAEVQAAAVHALADWPTNEPAQDLIAVVGSSTDTAVAETALRGYLRMAEAAKDGAPEQLASMYEAAFAAAKTADAKRLILASIGNQQNGILISLVTRCLSEPELQADASATMAKLQRAAFKAKASNNDRDAHNALDGDVNTRWSTNASQQNGQWYQLDFGWEATVGKVTLDSASSVGDYPRGYEVYASMDGQNWGEPVAKGAGTAALTEISFQPVKARFLKIVQTGSDGLWWSIHELTVDLQ
ncbi:MAG: ThuA domain-containing protein [Candidatus Hydrogenedentes bacterium]|nr:ThuA domain-containing protein [Candidatus Hydrogenedentota bacterium]